MRTGLFLALAEGALACAALTEVLRVLDRLDTFSAVVAFVGITVIAVTAAFTGAVAGAEWLARRAVGAE